MGKKQQSKIEQNESFNRDLFDKRYAQEYDIKLLMPIYDKIIQFVNDLDLYKPKILEAGCGLGIIASKLFKSGYTNYLGFDISSQAIKKARQNNRGFQSNFKIHSVYKLDSLKFIPDITIAVEVLEHIDDYKFIDGLKTRYLVGTVPNFWALEDAHLRIYPSKFYIWRRYHKRMEFMNWHKYKLTKKRFIYIFVARMK